MNDGLMAAALHREAAVHQWLQIGGTLQEFQSLQWIRERAIRPGSRQLEFEALKECFIVVDKHHCCRVEVGSER
jgi:hypothetical protein